MVFASVAFEPIYLYFDFCGFGFRKTMLTTPVVEMAPSIVCNAALVVATLTIGVVTFVDHAIDRRKLILNPASSIKRHFVAVVSGT